jgi:hypothetical protein
MSQPELSREGAVFEARLEEWRKTHLGEHVLIKDADVVGFYPSLDAAFAEGTRRFGLEPFFVKQVQPRDVVNVSLFGRRMVAAK